MACFTVDFSDETWTAQVVEPSVQIIKSFLDDKGCSDEPCNGSEEMKLIQRDLWTQYVCEVSLSMAPP